MLKLFLLRHGEAQHNVASHNPPPGLTKAEVLRMPEFRDAPLTEKGRGAAAGSVPPPSLLQGLQNEGKFLVVCSSLSRAMETAARAPLPPAPLLITDLVREQAGNHLCDARSRRTDVSKNIQLFWPRGKTGGIVPVETLEETLSGETSQFWEDAETKVFLNVPTEEDELGLMEARESRTEVERRVLAFLKFFSTYQDFFIKSSAKIILVSHAAFFRHLLALLEVGSPSSRRLKNCEWRELTLGPSLSAEEGRLVQQKIADSWVVRSPLKSVEEGKPSFYLFDRDEEWGETKDFFPAVSGLSEKTESQEVTWALSKLGDLRITFSDPRTLTFVIWPPMDKEEGREEGLKSELHRSLSPLRLFIDGALSSGASVSDKVLSKSSGRFETLYRQFTQRQVCVLVTHREGRGPLGGQPQELRKNEEMDAWEACCREGAALAWFWLRLQ